MQTDLAIHGPELLDTVRVAAFQGVMTLPFLITWALRRYQPYEQWQRIRARWHRDHIFRLRGP